MTEQANWLEISLTVSGELAEAVADVLARFIPAGVVIESTHVEDDPDSAGRVSGPMRVYGYIPIDEALEQTRHKIEEGLWYLSRIEPLPPAEFRPLIEQDWISTWKKNYHPIEVGAKILILPEWAAYDADQRIPIRIDPGMAFGTGTHPTTQLCLELLERWTPAGEPVFDIGSGSGILSIAAVKLGATHAYGADIDGEATINAERNASLNEVSVQTSFLTGSVEDVLAGCFPIRQTPLVLANMIAPILTRLFGLGLADLPLPGGHLLLSGMLEEQEEAMRATIAAYGLQVVARQQIEDWVALVTKRTA